MFEPTRRDVVGGLLLLAAGAGGSRTVSGRSTTDGLPDFAPFRTPYKYGKLILEKSGVAGSFDEKSVDCPFVFSADGPGGRVGQPGGPMGQPSGPMGQRFYMTYVGFDGVGYQTGLAVSDDLVHWERVGLILGRDASDPITRYNLALMCILRDDALESPARLRKVDGRYLGAWHAYPNPGYESGPAVIGLAWSDDLLHWKRTDPILRPEDGAEWERGGLYKPYLVKSGDTYYLYYNAKNNADRGWIEQTGVATSKDLKTWTRYPGNPIVRVGPPGSWDARFASDPAVLRYKKWWALYYYGLAANGRARDLLALGENPYHFTKVPEILIDVGPPGSIDEDYAHKPSVISHQGVLYHFYCAVGGKWPNDVRGISVARSQPW